MEKYYLNLRNKNDKTIGEVVAEGTKEELKKLAKHYNSMVGESGDVYKVQSKPFLGGF